MRFVLDTHALIWFINGDKLLPTKTRHLIENSDTECYISIASLWEIAIKISLNKLEMKTAFSDLSEILISSNIDILPITFEHINQLTKLKYFHRDPFDRIIISQSIVEKLPVITKDDNFSKYKISTLWN